MTLIRSINVYHSVFLFSIPWHLLEASLFDVAFISITWYTRALYGSIIVMVFYIGACAK